MIDRNVFANWMGALGARIAKEAPPQLVAVYYDTLSRHLDTAQFEVALSRMVHRPSEYFTAWPSPTEIVAAAQLQPTFDTTAEFAKLESVLRLSVPTLPIIPQLEAHCDPRTVRVFEALGGLARYRRLTDFEAPGYRREFLDRLKEVVEHEAVGRLTAPHVLPPTALPSAPAKHTNHNPPATLPDNAELVTAEVIAASGRSWREEVGPRPTPVDGEPPHPNAPLPQVR